MGRKFTPQEDGFLKANYLTIPAKRMAKMLGRTEGTARQRMKILGIRPPEHVIEQFKRESYIKKGNVPPNKGKKIIDLYGPEALEKMKATQFKKGELPHTTLYDGAITIRRDKTGRRYKWIRISKANWQMLHVYNWQQTHGEVPPGHIVVFKNKANTMDCSVELLELISLEQNMLRNTIHNYPVEIKTAIRTVKKLKRKIHTHEQQTN